MLRRALELATQLDEHPIEDVLVETMSTIEIRRFRRDDREQATRLVNIHAGAVIPGMATSVNAVMSQLGLIHRTVGINGTRLTAVLGHDELGNVEVDSREDLGRQPLHSGWADIGNLHVVEAYRRRRVGAYFMGQAAQWLDLARLDRVLDYARPEERAYDAFLRAVGFRLLTRTERGWRRTPNSTVQAIALTASAER